MEDQEKAASQACQHRTGRHLPVQCSQLVQFFISSTNPTHGVSASTQRGEFEQRRVTRGIGREGQAGLEQEGVGGRELGAVHLHVSKRQRAVVVHERDQTPDIQMMHH